MVMSFTKHLWTSSLSNGWTQQAYYSDHQGLNGSIARAIAKRRTCAGGCQNGWPSLFNAADLRIYTAFWGPGQTYTVRAIAGSDR
jgi:hypothetical protein